ncbi:MAG: hypothetical protein RH860_08605 [Cytophagales bacterium]
MNRVFRVRAGALFCAVAFAIAIASCKNDDPNPLDQRINELKATWKLGSVKNDNADVTGQYAGFTLTIEGTSYSTVSGGNPWPESGTYEINSSDLNKIIRSDGTIITIDEITPTVLVLSFNYTSLSGGRTKGVTGDFTFSLIK